MLTARNMAGKKTTPPRRDATVLWTFRPPMLSNNLFSSDKRMIFGNVYSENVKLTMKAIINEYKLIRKNCSYYEAVKIYELCGSFRLSLSRSSLLPSCVV